ncbi:hypothetical protein VC83_06254 [Pseudogymnoascus destructans]|uniref:Uncharacterized protein n=2 Tax=Pseudogymnoascus destructans TaxID=655981 RepID=L8GAN4_PSED2|nr:uncharacterized protein VC83_06254 [Pseudogymnoascus destructans]ELR09703.1 hypothetical protein GMDG_04189 [Pseudogymnoascus destructans 20631-21]OAF58837.1 hypothetical protein VC83_06254 [Pseudogymnoascus destructans]
MDSPTSPTPVEEQRQPLDCPDVSQLSSPSFDHRINLPPTRCLINFEPLRQPNTAYQHDQDSLVWGQQQSFDSPDATQLFPLAFGHRRNLLPARRLIDFEPLRQPNATYQHGRDSPPWGQQQLLDPLIASPSSPLSVDHGGHLLPARRLIDFEPLRRPRTRYQHGRDSPVWGQPLDSPDAAELDKPSFQSDDPFLPAPRLINLEPLRQSSATPRWGSPDWGREPFFKLPDASGSFPREWYAPEFQIVYSNGWINAIPVRPLGYEWLMLPVQPSQYDRDSLVSEDSEPLSINGPDLFQDPRKSKWLRAHHRSMSIERACKAWAYELRNSVPNSDPTDVDTKSLFGSLERLEMSFVQNQPGIEAPQESFVKQLPKRYEISKMRQDDLESETSEDVEDLPFWLRPWLGIRLPPGMVDLAAPRIPHYLVRKLADPQRFLPSKLSFKKNFPFRNVLPKKGQIGLHPAFRTAAPEDILKAERELELAKERRFLAPEEAWRSPIINDFFSSNSGRESLWEYPLVSVSDCGSLTDELEGLDQLMPEYPLTSVSDRGSLTNELQGLDQLMPETYSRSVNGGSFISVLFDQAEAFSDVDEATILSDQIEAFPDVDEAIMFSNEFMESPDIGPITMFPGRDIELDQGPISLDQVMQSPIVVPVSMEPPVGDQAAMAEHVGTESPIESLGSDYYFGQGMEYLTGDIARRHFRKGTESPIEDEDSVYSVLEMAYRKSDRAPIFYDQDTEHRIEDQDQEAISSSESIKSSLVSHEDLPIIKWFFDYWEDNSEPLGQPTSSNQVEKTKGYYKRNSADFAHLPPIDFTKSYNDFCTTQFGSLVTGGGFQDYNSSNEQTVEKTTEVTDDPLESIEVYWPQDHEARMRELFAEIELEGATRILTTWQEVYVERGEEGGTEEEGVQEKQAETALEDSKENIAQEPAVPLERKSSKVKSWFGGLTAERENRKERRKSQGAELEMNGKQMSWLGRLASAREKPMLESMGDSIGSVPQGPPDLLMRKNSKRVSWFGGPAKKQKQTEEVFGDSQEKIETALTHPLEQKGSKRRSWFPAHLAEKQEQTEEVFGDRQEEIDPGIAHPLERKHSKRTTWFGGHPTEKEGRTSEDSHGMLIQGLVHPLERKGSKRRSWFPGHPAKKEQQTKPDSEDNKLTQASVDPLERKGSKRRSWLPGHSAEREAQTSDDNHGKIIQENVHPLERKASKRRSWFPAHPAGKEEQPQKDSEDSYGKSTQAPVHPLERKTSKRRSWFPGHHTEKAEQPQRDSEDSYGKSTQASVNLLERRASKRKSWFPRSSTDREVRTSEDSHGKSTQGSVFPLEPKTSKRRSWFGMVSPESKERTEDALEGNDEKVPQEPVTPLERKRSKRMSWLGITPAKKTEQTHEDFDGSKEEIIQGTAEPSEKMRAKRASWLGGLNTPDDNHSKITQGPADQPQRKHRKRASLFGLPSEKEKTERRNQEERRRKRSSWFV